VAKEVKKNPRCTGMRGNYDGCSWFEGNTDEGGGPSDSPGDHEAMKLKKSLKGGIRYGSPKKSVKKEKKK